MPEYRYEVHYKFSGDCDRVENWLINHCIGEFSLTVNNLPMGSATNGNAFIAFEKESDRSLFRDQVLKGI